MKKLLQIYLILAIWTIFNGWICYRMGFIAGRVDTLHEWKKTDPFSYMRGE